MRPISIKNEEHDEYFYDLECEDIKIGMYQISKTGKILSNHTGLIMKTRDHKSRNGSAYESIGLTTNHTKGKG